MKRWFEKFPYPGWMALLLFLFVGSVVIYHFEKQKYNPEYLASRVQKDFNKREALIYVDALTGFFQRNYRDSTTISAERKYKWFIIKGGESVNWNTTSITLTPAIKENADSFLTGGIVRLNHTTYYLRSWALGSVGGVPVYALTFIPIAKNYEFENRFFKSHFVADERIPSSTLIADSAIDEGITIYTNSRKPAFSLHFKESPTQMFKAGFLIWAAGFIFLFCLFVWAHKVCMFVAGETKPIYGWLLLFAFVAGCVMIRYYLGLPLAFKNTTFFSPKVLSSSELVNSFGDLVILALANTWLVVFFLAHVPVSRLRVRHNFLDVLFRVVISASLIFILFFIQADWIYKLVIDSKISFEVSDFSQVSLFTFWGIAILCVITINIIFTLNIIIELLKPILSGRVFRFFLVAVFGLICICYLQDREITFFYFTILFLCIVGMVLLDAFGLPIRLFANNHDIINSPHTYIWFVVLCAWITIEIFYFNYSKEKELRKVFANKQEQRDDARIAYAFENLYSELQEDQSLKTFLRYPNGVQQVRMSKRIIYRYLNGPLSKYDATIYYYNEKRVPFPGQDTADVEVNGQAEKIIGRKLAAEIVYLDDQGSKNIYWGLIPVLDNALRDTLGFLGINLAVNKKPQTTYISSFLQQNYNPSDQQYFDKYSYAIYRNADLWTQAGSKVFSYRSTYSGDREEEYRFRENLFNSTLFYHPSPEELIQVVYERNVLVNGISLFSYVLAVLFLMWGLLFLLTYFVFNPFRGRVWRRKRRWNFTIRTKVNFTILATVFLSLIAIGTITVSFLQKRYKDSQQRNLKNLMFYFSQNIIHFIEDNTLDLGQIQVDSMKMFSELSYRLNMLSSEQGVDINLYNGDARLIATSQSEMLQKDFLSGFMNRAVYTELKSGAQPDLFVAEKIGELEYESLYLPLRNRNDQIIAYLNLPYYASQYELKEEISNILATLINIYTLIFFFSGVSAIFISNSIIRSFRLLIHQFRTIRLQHNVLINWPHRDELGLLVKEYNAMIMKVEDMATKLASKEREAAWRELALQVAHEIKNPLTPMKLNIQYLQNAIKSKREDVPVLASRITQALIEEIENLNIIASEFAHFAKMPEAKPEVFHVNEMLQSVLELFQLKENPMIVLRENAEPIRVVMDKGYFRRVFTNLIKNAAQAIPEDRQGVIEVSFKAVHNKVYILVKDNGTGIDPKLQKKMFTPYFTTKSSGTGIGLSMSKKMVEHSNGEIWFETEVGVGTTFFVQLPAV